MHISSWEEGSCSIGKAGRAPEAHGKQEKGRDTLSPDQLQSCSEIACRQGLAHGMGTQQRVEPRPSLPCSPALWARQQRAASSHGAGSETPAPGLQAVSSRQPAGLLAAAGAQEENRTLSTGFAPLGAEAPERQPAEDAVGLDSFSPCSSCTPGSRAGVDGFQ